MHISLPAILTEPRWQVTLAPLLVHSLSSLPRGVATFIAPVKCGNELGISYANIRL